MDHLNKEEKKLLQDIKDKDKENAEIVPHQEEESEQDLDQQTHNTVF
jgi:hypothetical protein